MASVRFSPIEAAYKIANNKPVVELYGKTTEGKRICVQVKGFEPYFWILGQGPIADERIVRIEEHTKNYLGQQVLARKAFVGQPSDVPLVRDSYPSLEADIPYTRRYLIDHKILPLQTYEAEGEYVQNNYKADTFLAQSIRPFSKDLPALNVLAVDIETHTQIGKEIVPSSEPVIMIGLYGEGLRKVLTWKHIDSALEYVEVLGSEKEMLERFARILDEYQPDVLTGYFSDGFDLPYIKARADKHRISLELGIDRSGIKLKKGTLPVAEIIGIAHIDVFKFVKRIFRTTFSSFKLDEVAKELLDEGKVSVDMTRLFAAWSEQNKELKLFAEYNLQDAKLTYQLCLKLLPNIIEFTRLLGLPPAEVSRMSFSQIVEWYLLREAPSFNELAPNRPKHREELGRMGESYEGGFVYEPTPGFYRGVAVFDFRSLYPTIISAHNISPDTIRHGEDSPDGVLKGFSFSQDKRGFISTVIENVIRRRLQLKDLSKKAQNDRLLEAQQLALKTVANSIYGYFGFFGARWYDLDCAKAITAYGRYYVKKVIERAKEAGLSVLYGDSIPYERTLFVQFENGDIQLIKIGELYDKYRNHTLSTLSYTQEGTVIFKPIRRIIRHAYKGDLLSITTRYGSTVVTPQHSIYTLDVKQNQLVLSDANLLKEGDLLVSLTNPQFKETYQNQHIFDLLELGFGPYEKELMLYPDQLVFPAKKGTCPYCNKETLLASHVFSAHKERKETLNKTSSFSWIGGKNAKTRKIPRYWVLDEDLAWLLGYYCAEGSVTDCINETYRKCLLSFGSQNRQTIERVKALLDQRTGIATEIITHFDVRNKKEMFYYRVQCLPIVATFQYSFSAGKGSEHKSVPWFIFTACENLRRAFLQGYLEGDGNNMKDKRYVTHFTEFSTKSKELASGLDFLFKSVSNGVTTRQKEIKHVAGKYRTDKPTIQSLRSTKHCHMNACGAKIRTITKLPSTQPYVYDVEVSGTHNFVDAEGMILIHNTDSFFVHLNGKSMEEVLAFVKQINEELPGIMELEYEGFYSSGIFVATKGAETGAKKKYALMSESGKMKVRGFETVRRNLSPIAKETQETVLRMSLQGKEKEEVIAYIKGIVKQLRAKEIPLEKVIIKTQISRSIEQYDNTPPHVAIAMKMQAQGQRVGQGTVVQYVVTEGKNLIRDRAKMPSDVKQGEYDANYYITNQVVPSVERILEVFGYDSKELLSEHQQSKLQSFFG